MKRRLDLFVSSLLIKLSQVISPWTYAKFGPNHVKSSLLLLLICLGIASLFYNNFSFASIIILSSSANVDPGSNNWYSISISHSSGIRTLIVTTQIMVQYPQYIVRESTDEKKSKTLKSDQKRNQNQTKKSPGCLH